MGNRTVASGLKRLWQRMKKRKKMMELSAIQETRADREAVVVPSIQQYGFSCFHIFHKPIFLEQMNPAPWIFIGQFLSRGVFYFKTIKHKILLIAHKNIFWGLSSELKMLNNCLKTSFDGLRISRQSGCYRTINK